MIALGMGGGGWSKAVWALRLLSCYRDSNIFILAGQLGDLPRKEKSWPHLDFSWC